MATRNDVAKLAGVSTATVSRVVNGSSSVSEETRQLVLAAIQQLNYVPNVIAKSLRTKSSYTIAFVVHDVTNPFFSEMFRGICDEAGELGYSALIYQYVDDVTYMKRILERNVDGIITFLKFSDNILNLVSERRIPIFYAGRVNDDDENCVGYLKFDFQQAGCDMVKYLYNKGHRRIGLIARSQRINQDIHKGYQKAFTELGLPYDSDKVAWFDSYKFIIESGYQCMKELLKRDKGITAVVCNSDWVAIGAINAISESGKKVPDDISVVGFDDLLISQYSNPPLTTIKTEGYDEGRLGCRMLIDYVKGNSITSKVLKNEIIERKSVKDLNKS